ncbi:MULTISPECIES: BlaI/MecI/CopY family transcriptional regulator [unclassified Sphingobacterium]|uniref:BlaI/MecI/CopY family transcriptional regulator n=1 Tax=unclassified Sphingobacterium TaxID=2609468 RepID=UPI00265CD26F|nr:MULTISPECIES: BlaI/MecI/CopY family transcriptional regulator [unclassified Sphingobacterium]WKK57561.1 BlaI/MecI/CopY family transcriptional regulator [Sphingobacterium sp. BN32]
MEKLTIQEEEAMLSIWQLEGGFIRDILDNLKSDEMPYTTLASTIRNLEKKGYVKAVKYANAKRYEPLITSEEYKAKFMNSFVGDYFKNSYKEMVSFFVKEEKLSPNELEEIMDMIRNNKS